MTDDAFLARFEATSLPSFGHRDHVRMAYAYARRGGAAHAIARAREGLRRLMAAAGAPYRYHDTLTTAWAPSTPSAVRWAGVTAAVRLNGRPP